MVNLTTGMVLQICFIRIFKAIWHNAIKLTPSPIEKLDIQVTTNRTTQMYLDRFFSEWENNEDVLIQTSESIWVVCLCYIRIRLRPGTKQGQNRTLESLKTLKEV